MYIPNRTHLAQLAYYVCRVRTYTKISFAKSWIISGLFLENKQKAQRMCEAILYEFQACPKTRLVRFFVLFGR